LRSFRLALELCSIVLLGGYWLAFSNGPAAAAEVTLRGSLVCNGACVADPKKTDHVLVLFAIEGTAEVVAERDRIVKNYFPARGLDAEAAQKLLDQFSARLKYYIAPDSPAFPGDKNTGAGHYCMPAVACAVTGGVSEKDGKKWIRATRMTPCPLSYPARMLRPDRPFVRQSQEPLVLKVGDRLTLRCIAIPAGTFLMGTPFYMWPYHVEEYPHRVTLTRDYYLSEIPITQEMYEAVMGSNPSTIKDPQLPVQNPSFADIRSPLKVKSKKPNAWGLYDMASCWWEITGDKAAYHVRRSVVDPHYPPGVENARSQRTGRGIVNERWSIGTHEFITEKADYAGQKFRIVVETRAPSGAQR
jgi:formylglycine-generating enzyme required for sulfatase activity